jgi:hypothetical protein
MSVSTIAALAVAGAARLAARPIAASPTRITCPLRLLTISDQGNDLSARAFRGLTPSK